MMTRTRSALFLSSALLFFPAAQAYAQAGKYPAKPIRMVVGYPAGGPSDILGRLVAQKLTEAYGQQTVVDNRPGASGNIGAEHVSKSAPDGYTLLLIPATLAVNPSIYKNVPYDPLRDFTMVSLVAEGPFILVVHPSLPVRNVQDLIALAKRNPDKLNYASASLGGLPHLSGELLKSMTGIRMTHIPYKGAAPATVDVVAGHVSIMFNNMLSAVPHIKSNRLRPLGVTTRKRSSAMPEVPTIEEAGVKGYEVAGWYGVLAPAGLSRELLTRLNADINRGMRQPDVVKRLAVEGMDAVATTPEAFTQRMERELVKWAAVVKAAGITSE